MPLFHPAPHGPLTDFEPRSILICQLRQIGDVILTTPSIEMLAKRYPNAAIDVYTEKKCVSVLEHNPHIRKVHVVDRSLGFLESLKFYASVGRSDYDLVVDFQQLPRIRWMLMFSSAKVRLTFNPPWYNKFFYTHWAKECPGPYAAKCKAATLAPLGLEWDGQPPRIYLSDDEMTWGKQYLAEQGLGDNRLVTVDPTHRRAARRWPAHKWGEFIRMASDVMPDLRFLILYGPGELDDARAVVRACGLPEVCIVPDRILSLREMAAVQKHAAIQIGNCSAPRHFAAALDTPSLTILGATSDAWTCPTGPHDHVQLGLPCQPCNENTCPSGGYRCLEELPVQTVFDKFQRMLFKNRKV